jgi:hypothetical protein
MDTVNIWIAIWGGAFGGLLHTLYLNKNSLLLPSFARNHQKHWNLGFIADILLGIGAGVAVVYFIAPETMLKQISLSIISGFGGDSLLGSITTKLAIALEEGKVNTLNNLLLDYDRRFEEINEELQKKKGSKS